MQQFMFTDMLILAVCKCTTNAFIWLLNTPPMGISYKNVSDRQLYMFFSGDLAFSGYQLAEKTLTLWKSKSIDCFFHSTFCLKKQSGRASINADMSSGLQKYVEGRILCFCCKLLVSSIIMFKYKLLLSCCWQWWNLLCVSTATIS